MSLYAEIENKAVPEQIRIICNSINNLMNRLEELNTTVETEVKSLTDAVVQIAVDVSPALTNFLTLENRVATLEDGIKRGN